MDSCKAAPNNVKKTRWKYVQDFKKFKRLVGHRFNGDKPLLIEMEDHWLFSLSITNRAI